MSARNADIAHGTDDFAELLRGEADYSAVVEKRGRPRRALLATLIIFLLIVGSIGGYVFWALNAPLPPPTLESAVPLVPQPVAAVIPLPADDIAALSVSGADDYLGPEASGIWMSTGSGEPQSIASITKLIAALVVLERKPLGPEDPGPTITFSKADSDLYDKYYLLGATILRMPTGTQMSQRDAIATMLLPSASNYAEAVTTWAFGSQRAFLDATRGWLSAHNLTGTTIVEPTGISAENTSTPADLIAIGKIATAQPVVAALAASYSVVTPALGALGNTNNLLGTEGITGLKTGNLGEGRFALLYSATIPVAFGNPLTVTGVVLDGQSREAVNASVIATLSGLRNGFVDVPLAEADQEVGTYTSVWGGTARLVIARTASIPVWSDTAIAVAVETSDPTGIEDGAEAGSVTWAAGPATTTVPLEIQGTIEPPSEFWRLTHPAELWTASNAP